MFVNRPEDRIAVDNYIIVGTLVVGLYFAADVIRFDSE